MSTAIMEAQLAEYINGDSALMGRGCRGAIVNPSGVAVEQGGVRVGLWQWRNGTFVLTIGGKDPVISVETVAEAVRYTREQLCP